MKAAIFTISKILQLFSEKKGKKYRNELCWNKGSYRHQKYSILDFQLHSVSNELRNAFFMTFPPPLFPLN